MTDYRIDVYPAVPHRYATGAVPVGRRMLNLVRAAGDFFGRKWSEAGRMEQRLQQFKAGFDRSHFRPHPFS